MLCLLYVYATLVPENQATAAAQYEVATAFAKVNGTPTPLAWNVVVITPVPSPVPPTFTPLPAAIGQRFYPDANINCAGSDPRSHT